MLTPILNIVIADDHPALLIGIKHELSKFEKLKLVGLASNSTQLISILNSTPCDVLVTDYVMPGGAFGDGISLFNYIKLKYPLLKIIVFTMLDNPATIRDLLRHGVTCIISKADSVENIMHAIRATHANKSYFSPTTDEIVQRLNLNHDELGNFQKLSKRESEIIRLYVSGYTITQIAEQLHRSKQTVSSQKQRAMQKLGVVREVDLLKCAMEIGLV